MDTILALNIMNKLKKGTNNNKQYQKNNNKQYKQQKQKQKTIKNTIINSKKRRKGKSINHTGEQ